MKQRIRTLVFDRTNQMRLLLPAVWIGLHLYAGRPLLIAAAAGGVAPFLAWGGVLLLALISILPFALGRSVPHRWRSIAHWFGYASMSLFALLLVFVFAGDLVRLLYALAASAIGSLPNLNVRVAGLMTLAAAGVLSLVGFLQARRPAVRNVSIPIEDLPKDLEGFRIVQLSDVHIGPTIQRCFVESLVKRVNELDADMITITGDLVDGYEEDLREHAAPLARMRAPHGVFYVTGNHEYYWRASEWLPTLTSFGLDFLKNEHRVIQRGDAKLVVAGITDPVGRHTHKQDMAKALRGAPDNSVKLLLSHRPQPAKEASRRGIDLQLSGHTHGGQFFPFNYVIRLFQPIVAGLHRVGNLWLYVSRGTGYWGPPSRLGVGGEITLLTLSRQLLNNGA